jgi:hypothetical protein
MKMVMFMNCVTNGDLIGLSSEALETLSSDANKMIKELKA